MRVLHVVNDFWPDAGGVQRAVLDLARALQQRGVEVKVITATRMPGAERRTFDAVPVMYTGYLFRLSQALISPKLVLRAWTEEADIIHTYMPYPWSADWAALVGKLRGKPVILTYHNEVAGLGWKRPVMAVYRASLLQLTLSLSRRIVVTTPQYVKVSTVLPRFANKVVMIPVGVDLQQFRLLAVPSDGKTIGFLSLLRDTHRYKGLDVLLEAMVALRQRGVGVRLKVGGSGNLMSYYKARVQSLGLGHVVEFLGFVPAAKIAEFYNSLDAFVLPSVDCRFEGFGLVALEAMACGRPVLTTTAAGVSPLISDGRCGLVVPPGNPIALAEAIEKLLSDGPLRMNMGRQARSIAEDLSWDSIAERYKQLYTELLSGRRERH